ncbi:MAG: hypothetical protein VW620_11490 [Rhodospirillales bacterium]
MPKRISIYPPKGEGSIEIFEEDLASFEAKGWRADSPRASKKKAVKSAVIVTPEMEKETE